MKKIISVLVMSVLFAGSVFAMDLRVSLKGILGADNSDVKGTCIGGGFDINVDIKNGFGFQIESNIVPAVITKENEGLTFTDNMIVNIPARLGTMHVFLGLDLVWEQALAVQFRKIILKMCLTQNLVLQLD